MAGDHDSVIITAESDGDGAALADVIRHPYFTSLNEKEAFTLALEGCVFGQIVSTADVSNHFICTFHHHEYTLHSIMLYPLPLLTLHCSTA